MKELYIPFVENDIIRLPLCADNSFIYGARSARGNVYKYEAIETTEPKYSAAWEHLHEVENRQRFWVLSPGKTVVDAGACFGSYTCSAAADGAFVHAFEPDPALFDALQRVVKLNDFTTVKLYNEKANIDKLNLERLDMIKIDVEGDELQVLKNAMGHIKKFKPTLLIECHISMNPDILQEVCEMVHPFKRLTQIREAVNEGATQHMVIDF